MGGSALPYASEWMFACFVLHVAVLAQPQQRWVDVTAPPTADNNCADAMNPCQRLSTAAAWANAGDTINVVASGTYVCEYSAASYGQFIVKDIYITSYPPGATVRMNCNGTGPAFTFFGIAANLNGFEISNVSSAVTTTSGCAAPIAISADNMSASRYRHRFTNMRFVNNHIWSNANAPSSLAGAVSISYACVDPNRGVADNEITFTDCAFVNNSAVATNGNDQNGGAGAGAVNVYLTSHTAHGVHNNTIRFLRCTFDGNGGTSYMPPPTPNLPNYGTSSGAVAISLFGIDVGAEGTGNVSSNSISFESCTFTGNSGGGVSAPGAGALAILMTAATTPPLAAVGNNTISITDSVFDSNSASFGPNPLLTGGAGAVQIVAVTGEITTLSIRVQQSTFVNNRGVQFATTAGVGDPFVIGAAGAIAIMLESVQTAATALAVTRCRFLGNTIFDSDGSQVAAGGVSLYDYSQSVQYAAVSVDDTLFDSQIGGNSVSTGAGAWSYRWDTLVPAGRLPSTYGNNTFAFRRCNFTQNAGGWATENLNAPSGAAAVSAYLSTVGVIGDVTARNDWMFESCVFRNNTSAPTTTRVANGTASLSLGPVDMESGSGAIFFGSAATFHTYRVTIVDSEFSGNAGLCGAVCVTTGAPSPDSPSALTIRNSAFVENRSPCDTCNGGAVCVRISPFSIINSSFTSNRAGYAGGALDLGFDATGTLFGVTFIGDTAPVASEINSVAADNSLAIAASVFNAVPDSALSFVTTMNIPAGTNFTAQSVIRCPPGYSAFAAGRLRGCQLCTAGMYSISGGVIVDTNYAAANCSKCPFGAVCHGGSDVAAVSGYWGSPESNSQSFVACQPGLCCSDAATCAFTDICRSDVTHRTGTLCSTCASGYSEVYGSVNCRLSENCHDGGWFIAVSLLASGVIGCVFFYSESSNDGLVSTVVYYYQMIPFVVSTGSLDAVSSTLANVFNFRFHADSSAGVCPVSDLDPIDKRLLSLLLIACIGLVLLVIWFIHSRGWGCDDRIRRAIDRTREWFCVRCCCRTETPLLSASASEPWLSPDAGRSPAPASRQQLTRDRIAVAATKFVLYSFSAVAQALFVMLQCVNVSPAGSDAATPTARLFIDPDAVACYTDWQRGLFVVMAAVLLAPLLLLLWTVRHSSRAASEGSASAVLVVLSSPFHTRTAYWESLRLIWRLALVVVSTFVLSAVPRSVVVAIISIAMLTLHVYFQPLKDVWSQRIGLLTLSALSVLSVFNVAPATTVENASTANDQLSATFASLTTVQTVVLLIPAVVGGWMIFRRQIADCCRTTTDANWHAPSVVVDRNDAINRSRPDPTKL